MMKVTASDGRILDCKRVDMTVDGFTRMRTDAGEILICYQENGEWVQPGHPKGGAMPWDL